MWGLATHPSQNIFITCGHDRQVCLWNTEEHTVDWSISLEVTHTDLLFLLLFLLLLLLSLYTLTSFRQCSYPTPGCSSHPDRPILCVSYRSTDCVLISVPMDQWCQSASAQEGDASM